MNEDRIEIWDRLTLLGRRWYWRAVAGNGEIVAIGEGYNSAEARNRGIGTASRILAKGQIMDGKARS